MNLNDLPAVITALNTALPDWVHDEPQPLSRIHDHTWTHTNREVRLAVWGSVSTTYASAEYTHAGRQVSHLVLSTVDQVPVWLHLVGADT